MTCPSTDEIFRACRDGGGLRMSEVYDICGAKTEWKKLQKHIERMRRGGWVHYDRTDVPLVERTLLVAPMFARSSE